MSKLTDEQRAAIQGGMIEEVRVVGYHYMIGGDSLLDHQKPGVPHDAIMTVAQHQRITAALRGEVERLNRDAKNDAIAYKAAIERQEELRAELDAIRKQEPVVRLELVENLKYGGMHIRQWDNIGRLGPGRHQLYAAPPAAAMDGGMGWIPVSERLPHADEPSRVIILTQNCGVMVASRGGAVDMSGDFLPGWTWGVINDIAFRPEEVTHWMPIDYKKVRELRAAHRQASQQEGEKK